MENLDEVALKSEWTLMRGKKFEGEDFLISSKNTVIMAFIGRQ